LSRVAGLSTTAQLRAGVTRAAALAALRAQLCDAGIEEGAADARLLLCAAGGLDHGDLIRAPEALLSEATLLRLAPMTRRRAAGEPVSRILARREFWGLSLAISPAVLDPRPDTETLVEAVLREFSHKRRAPLRILELGVGSGAILCALLTEFEAASGVAVDLSLAAAMQARANLAALGLTTRASVAVGSWAAAIAGAFDVIVSNPPYVASGAIGGLAREVRDYDPAIALDGGRDGLDAYRAIASQLAPLLAERARFYLEVGAGQADRVVAILAAQGLTAPATYADLAGLARVVAGGVGDARNSLGGTKNEPDRNMPLGVEQKKD
jgi:release factor glutamine methyltransferase